MIVRRLLTGCAAVLLAAVAVPTALLAMGCTPQRATTRSDDVGRLRPRADRPYRLTTPQVQQDIRDLMERVPGATPSQWTKIARKLAAYGEPAVPQLVANLDSSDEAVQTISAYVLGVIKDPRALDALHRATIQAPKNVRYEAATAMLRMGDRRGLPTMIDGLEHPDPLIRARAILVLQERTGETFGYRADGRPADRAAAVSRWRAWLQQTGGVASG